MSKIIITLAALFACIGSYSQVSAIDAFCNKLDSSLVDDKVILHSVRHQEKFPDARCFDYYYIDTVKRTLIKSMYELNFQGDGDFIEFYYKNDEIVKFSIRHRFDGRKLSGSFYFKSHKLIAHVGGEIDGKIAFDVENILETGNSHMANFPEILKSLKLVSQFPAAAKQGLTELRQDNKTSLSTQFLTFGWLYEFLFLHMLTEGYCTASQIFRFCNVAKAETIML